ncbi:hypothetical protein [Nostoc sp.]|uniref:hypothetical protein n=1 Tax=Nostoc sp. TaxID=1180 RepID=UPI002FFD131D
MDAIHFDPSPNLSPKKSYGVHTSLKIPPSTWFRHLALGCAIALEACHCVRAASRREEERRTQVRVADKQSL